MCSNMQRLWSIPYPKNQVQFQSQADAWCSIKAEHPKIVWEPTISWGNLTQAGICVPRRPIGTTHNSIQTNLYPGLFIVFYSTHPAWYGGEGNGGIPWQNHGIDQEWCISQTVVSQISQVNETSQPPVETGKGQILKVWSQIPCTGYISQSCRTQTALISQNHTQYL